MKKLSEFCVEYDVVLKSNEAFINKIRNHADATLVCALLHIPTYVLYAKLVANGMKEFEEKLEECLKFYNIER